MTDLWPLPGLGERLTQLRGVLAMHATTGPAGTVDLVVSHRGPGPARTHQATCQPRRQD